MAITKFSEYVESIHKITSLVENYDSSNTTLPEFFQAIQESEDFALEDVTGTQGIANIVLPLVIKMARRMSPTFVQEAEEMLEKEFNDAEFLKWIEQKTPEFKKAYGDKWQTVLYSVALAKFNKMSGANVSPHSRSNGKSNMSLNKKIWEN